VERFLPHLGSSPESLVIKIDGADALRGGAPMLARPRRPILTAVLAACLTIISLTAACGGSTASDKSNPGGVAAVKDNNPQQGQSAGTGGGVSARETAGALGTPIPTPGQTGSAAGKPDGSPSPSPSPSGR
jgi:hypothetical protein